MAKGGFSWKRATGVSNIKSKIARTTGIPTTKQGRKRKLDSMVRKGIVIPTSTKSKTSNGGKASHGILFWLFIGWWWYLFVFCIKICLLPFTLTAKLLKQKKSNQEATIAAIDDYYENVVVPQILANETKENILNAAEAFKAHFDGINMPDACKAYYMEKYENLTNYNQ